MVKRAALGVMAILGVGCAAPSDLGALVPPTADEDAALPQIDLHIAGRTRAVHLETFGESSAPLLLVLHGSLGDFRALKPFSALSDRYFVVMWDQRGNGLSERVEEHEYTWDSIVAEIDSLRERFSVDGRVTLLGHSFGAMYAALYTSRNPESVEQLALLEPAGLNGRIFGETFDSIINVDLFDPGMNEMFWQNELLSASSHEAMDYRALMILLNGKQTNYFCNPEKPPAYPIWRPGAYVEYLRGVRMGTGGGFGTPSFDFDFSSGLDNFRRSVLIVAGTCSALGPDFQQRYHVPLFREAEVVSIPNTGHRMFVEDFEAVHAALRRYFAAYAAP